MKQALTYSLKVWLTAATITPVLAYIIWSIFNTVFTNDETINYRESDSSFIDISNNASAFRVNNVSLDILQSTLYSIPYFAIICVVAFNLNKQSISVGYKKCLLTLISILLTVSPFAVLDIVDQETFNKLRSGILAFEAVIIIGIWLYNLKPATSKTYQAVR